jgi:hypothetical protein
MAMTLETYPRRNEQLLTQESSGTLILFNLDNGQYYALNEVGSRVWDLSDGTLSVSQIVETISGEYDAPADAVRADVLELLEELADEGIVSEGESVG